VKAVATVRVGALLADGRLLATIGSFPGRTPAEGLAPTQPSDRPAGNRTGRYVLDPRSGSCGGEPVSDRWANLATSMRLGLSTAAACGAPSNGGINPAE
jgi:hypothetical protein